MHRIRRHTINPSQQLFKGCACLMSEFVLRQLVHTAMGILKAEHETAFHLILGKFELLFCVITSYSIHYTKLYDPIITSHPGEMARLEVGATSQSVNVDRIGTARRFSRERGVIVVLKGARTVIARPDGLLAVCPTGNPGMATAGTGDVLTGMMAGLLAQGIPAWEVACAATYLHGLAGDLAAQRNNFV